MSVQIIINGENATESLKELSTLAAGIGASATQVPAQVIPTVAPVQSYTQPAQQVYQQPTFPQPPVQQSVPVQEPQHQAPTTPVPVSSAPTYTLEQLGVAAGPLVDAGRGPELTGWLNQRGAAALTQLDKAHYGEFAMFLRSLGAKI